MTRAHQSFVYFCNWNIYSETFKIEHVPVESATHVLYAFLDVGETGAVDFSDPWADLQKPVNGELGCVNAIKAQCSSRCAPATRPKLLFSVGGATRAENLRSALKEDSSRHRFCKTLISIVRLHAFHGIDIDFEEVRSRQENDNLLATLRLLKQLAPELILTVASPAGPRSICHMTIGPLDFLVDFWLIMAYDFSGSWSQLPEPHCNLFGRISGESAINMYVQGGATPGKLVLGCPLYAVQFKSMGPQMRQTQFLGTRCIKELTSSQTQEFERGSAGSFSEDGVVAFHESAATIYEKSLFIVSHGLGGIMWWECSQDYLGPASLIALGRLYLDRS